jgi:hypothetical protein
MKINKSKPSKWLKLFFLFTFWDGGSTYTRHVSGLQELMSLTKNKKLGEWMVHTLTCELCFIQSYLTADERRV